MAVPDKIIELRQLLAERFPQASRPAVAPAAKVWATGMAELDGLLGGGLARGELSELVGQGPGSGSGQIIHQLLRQAAKNGQFLALVDGADSFDVEAVEPDELARLLWVRCANTDEALKAADLLLRDRNFSLVVVDLKLNSAKQLRRISSSVWFRLGRLLEQNPAAVLVVTPQAMVGGAAWRVQVAARLGHGTLAKAPREVTDGLQFTLLRTALASEGEAAGLG